MLKKIGEKTGKSKCEQVEAAALNVTDQVNKSNVTDSKSPT